MDIKSQVMIVVGNYPNLTFDPIANTLNGLIAVDTEDLYEISIELSPYPEYFPAVYETGGRIPKKVSSIYTRILVHAVLLQLPKHRSY